VLRYSPARALLQLAPVFWMHGIAMNAMGMLPLRSRHSSQPSVHGRPFSRCSGPRSILLWLRECQRASSVYLSSMGRGVQSYCPGSGLISLLLSCVPAVDPAACCGCYMQAVTTQPQPSMLASCPSRTCSRASFLERSTHWTQLFTGQKQQLLCSPCSAQAWGRIWLHTQPTAARSKQHHTAVVQLPAGGSQGRQAGGCC
jgi:hypothetical protein